MKAQENRGVGTNALDGPVTIWAVVDRFGHSFAFEDVQIAAEVAERWDFTMPRFAPHRIIKLVEQPEGE